MSETIIDHVNIAVVIAPLCVATLASMVVSIAAIVAVYYSKRP